VLTPEPDERRYVSDIVYNELVAGKFRPEARAATWRSSSTWSSVEPRA